MRTDGRVKRNRIKIIFPIIIVFVFTSIIFGILITDNYLEKNTVEAVKVQESLDLMYKENPVNLALVKEIESYKKEKADYSLSQQRKDLNDSVDIVEQNGKVAYLTFDDGPSLVVTPQILDILDEYDIKATFFPIGYMAERHPGILKMTYDKGHSIGNHTYSHNYGYIYKNPKNLVNDLEKAGELFKEILTTDFNPKLMRFPGGSFGKKHYIEAVTQAGYLYFDWDALNGDAEGINISKERLVSRLKQTVKNQDKLIVLMHDTDYKPTTVEALADIIEYLKSEGYVFITLDQYIDPSLEA